LNSGGVGGKIGAILDNVKSKGQEDKEEGEPIYGEEKDDKGQGGK
jgi:hypothetical protein